MSWKVGQQVLVIHGHVDGANMAGEIVRLCSAPENAGKWLVRIGCVEIAVEDERLRDLKAYWDERNRPCTSKEVTATKPPGFSKDTSREDV